MESVPRHADYSSKGNAWDKRLGWVGAEWLVMRGNLLSHLTASCNRVQYKRSKHQPATCHVNVCMTVPR